METSSPFKKIAALSLLALAIGCGGGASLGDGVALATANPESVCSAIVAFSFQGAKTATVTAKGSNHDVLTTPAVTLDENGNGSIAVLGLAASTRYDFEVDASGADGAATAATSFTTGPLPPELAMLHMAVTPGTGAPSTTGYYLVEGTSNDQFAVDGHGEVRWYRQFDNFSEETKMQYDGSFTSFVGSTPGFGAFYGQYARYSADGTRLASYVANPADASEVGTPPVYTDNHELQITKDADGEEHLHFITYEFRPLSPEQPSTLAAWHMLVRQRASDGTVEFRWKTWDHFTYDADSTEPSGVTGIYDVDHMNSIKFDPTDGNYIVSMRHTDAVVEVDATTAEVIWQLGGKQATFTIEGDPLGGFYGQHDAQTLANGHVILYDNGLQHDPMESRAVEYALDPATKTAKLVWQFHHDPPIFTEIEGAVRRLSNGNTLVAFAQAGVVDEVDTNGDVVWEGVIESETTPILTYRITPQPSLYQYVAP